MPKKTSKLKTMRSFPDIQQVRSKQKLSKTSYSKFRIPILRHKVLLVTYICCLFCKRQPCNCCLSAPSLGSFKFDNHSLPSLSKQGKTSLKHLYFYSLMFCLAYFRKVQLVFFPTLERQVDITYATILLENTLVVTKSNLQSFIYTSWRPVEKFLLQENKKPQQRQGLVIQITST